MPIEVILTDRIRDAIEEVFTLDSATDELKNELRSWRRSEENFNKQTSNGHVTHLDEVINRNDATIPFNTVKKVYETLKKGIHVEIKEIKNVFTKIN